jgi:two-component system chemotaxis response regulator CheB
VTVLRDLPHPLTVPVLVVQHIDESFGASFCEWLNTQVPQTVSFAVDGDVLEGDGGPKVILAPANRHLVLQQGRLRLLDLPARHSCRPSVDHLFESIARECGSQTLACLLTGMGRDGAQGLLDIRRSGGHTIAQDEATSMIFGMPREAIKLGAAKQILPLGEIGATLAGMVTQGFEGK